MLTRGFRIIFSGILILSALPLAAQDYITHTVTKGQGLYSISKIYHVTIQDIVKANPGNTETIRVGQELRIPVKKTDAPATHTIQAGETLYSLAKANGVSVDDIIRLNPGISSRNFKAGETIVMPAALPAEQPSDRTEQTESDSRPNVTTHTVERKETIYRICLMYGLTTDEFYDANPEYRLRKLRKGDIVTIPSVRHETAVPDGDTADSAESQTVPTAPVTQNDAASPFIPFGNDTYFHRLPKDYYAGDAINAALILPFELDRAQTADQRKMVEFYQGVLLALDDVKQMGISVNLKVCDSGDEHSSIASILGQSDMAEMDVIFGPKYDSHIIAAAEFARQHGIPLVLPVSSTAGAVDGNPYVFQLSSSQSFMTDEVCDHFFRQFDNARIIEIGTGRPGTNPLIEKLRERMNMDEDRYAFFKMDSESEYIAEQLTSLLKPGYQNIFMTSSNGAGDVSSVLPILQLVTRTKDRSIETYLFGGPEYQVFAQNYIEQFFEIDTWFYTWFYTNTKLPESLSFGSRFRHAFGRQMLQTYPSYAEYGYDTARYFLTGISKYGSQFMWNLNRVSSTPIQMGFKFQKVGEDGGYVNHKVFFVHMSDSSVIEKIDFDK